MARRPRSARTQRARIKAKLIVRTLAAWIIVGLSLSSCEIGTPYSESSPDSYTGKTVLVPTVAYASGLEYYERGDPDFYFMKPKGYVSTTSKAYPLLIYLHGSGGRDNIAYLSSMGLGYYGELFASQNGKEEAEAFREKHPCFVCVPATDSYWDEAKLIALIEDIKAACHVNMNRIYLTGYSMGGSGSYRFANAYYEAKGQVFAAIVRMAGQIDIPLEPAIVKEASVWLQVGSNDTAERVADVEKSYADLKSSSYYSDAVETSDTRTISSCQAATLTLSLGLGPSLGPGLGGIEAVKKTIYKGAGHGIVGYAFADERLIPWIFDQSLAKR